MVTVLVVVLFLAEWSRREGLSHFRRCAAKIEHRAGAADL
jgi:hypothetical protein